MLRFSGMIYAVLEIVFFVHMFLNLQHKTSEAIDHFKRFLDKWGHSCMICISHHLQSPLLASLVPVTFQEVKSRGHHHLFDKNEIFEVVMGYSITD